MPTAWRAQNHDIYWTYVDYLHTHGQEINGDDRDLKKSFAALDRIALQEATLGKLDEAKANACIGKQDETQVRHRCTKPSRWGWKRRRRCSSTARRFPGRSPSPSYGW